VTREYYVNDAGRQMDILALSVWMRLLELAGTALPFPANAYQGEYVRGMARQLHTRHERRYLHPAQAVLRGAPSIEADPETYLDVLIANAKRLLGPDYASLHDFVLNEQLADCRSDLVASDRTAGKKRTPVCQGRGEMVSLDRVRRRKGPCRPA
jgi:arginyl-tRNA synthetase